MKRTAKVRQGIENSPTACEARGASVIDLGCSDSDRQGGFTLAELLIAMAVFTLIIGSVVTLLGKSQTIFRTEQGVSEMDQNARLLMDFVTRDIQQSKENSLGLGPRFRSIYSYDGPEGKTDEVTIVSSDTESKLPAAALPLMAASARDFSVGDRYVELIPNSAARVDPWSVINALKPDEELIVSGTRQDGSVQFDFIKVKAAKLTAEGAIGINFEPVDHRGVQPEVPFGETYQNGAFSMRPSVIKRYFVDRKTDRDHPAFELTVNDGVPITIARNVVAFQLRYLEEKDGELEGHWVKKQSISRQYKTQALEVTMTARTEIKNDRQAERLVTLASVIRPRFVSGSAFGSSGGGGGAGSPGLPGDGGNGGGGPGDGGGGPGDGGGGPGTSGGYPGGGYPGSSGFGGGNGASSGAGASGGPTGGGYNHQTRRIGKQPRLGERLNSNP
jgi:prepilin-type N-terminal cleavage/methylation domain-containing protein